MSLLADNNMKSNTKEDNQHLTPAHSAPASQEPGIMETETPEDEGNNEKKIQAEFKEGLQIGSGHQDHSKDMGGKQGFSHCKKRKYNMQDEKLEENVQQQQSEAVADDGLFNLDDCGDNSKMDVPEKEIPGHISVYPPGGLSPKTAREKYEQWCSITPGFNIKLGNHCPGEETAVIPDFSAEVVDNRVSAAARPHGGNKRKNSKRQVRQYLWLIRKQKKHSALPQRQYGGILTANRRNRRWPFPVNCYISDCPQKAARRCVNKLCRSCCVAVGGFCIRHRS